MTESIAKKYPSAASTPNCTMQLAESAAPYSVAGLPTEQPWGSHGCVDPAENTAPVQRGRPFQPGQSGNPSGRPRGSKNKLTDIFVAAIVEDFLQHGATTIERVRNLDPAAYLKLVSSMIPRELIVQREQDSDVDYAHLSAEEVGALVKAEGRRRYVQQALEHSIPSAPPGLVPAWPSGK